MYVDFVASRFFVWCITCVIVVAFLMTRVRCTEEGQAYFGEKAK